MFSIALAVCVCASSAAKAQTLHVLPYLQPGDGPTLEGSDVKVLRWLTDQKPGEFTVEYQVIGGPMRKAVPDKIALDFAAVKTVKKEETKKEEKKKVEDGENKKMPKELQEPADKNEPKPAPIPEKAQHYYRYTAELTDLPFNSEVRYCVKLSGKVVREATFKTRATADKPVRCVLVGDLAQGRQQQREVAFQMSRQKPDFLVALGDIVYPTGRMIQYMAYYWDTYNNGTSADPKTGAPLMADTTFYPVLGNHDISAKLSKAPDALAAYYFFATPKNGPGPGPWITPLDGDEAAQAKFRAATKDSYPFVDAYSFDYGAAHFTILNVNPAMKIESPEFLAWLRKDLMGTKAAWKFVCFHQPGFQSAWQHYPEQQVRPLQPIFEECGVDVTFGGHVHNYQRSVPLKFVPSEKRAAKSKKVDGVFTLDTKFDGVTQTVPTGVIHIVAGGGGASLYKPGVEKTAPFLRSLYAGNYADFTAKMVVDKHSFVTLDIAPDRLRLRALTATGEELDGVTITKRK